MGITKKDFVEACGLMREGAKFFEISAVRIPADMRDACLAFGGMGYLVDRPVKIVDLEELNREDANTT
jgi:hypothetical protein